MKRLLYVDNDYGTFRHHRLSLAQRASDAGWEVHVAVPYHPGAATLRDCGLHPHTYTLARRGVNPAGELRTIAELHALYARLRPSLVHHLRLKPVLYGGIAARLAGIPAVVHTLTGLGHLFVDRSATSGILRQLVKAGLRRAFLHPNCRILFENSDDQRELKSLMPDDCSVVVNGSGVDPDEFPALPEPPGRVTVVLPARMLWSKGVREFVEAARQLRERGCSARFALVGDTDDGNPAAVPRQELEQWAGCGVEWWGWREDIRSVYASAHIVCLPSWREGVPRALIEAAACTRPLVATAVPGCSEIVRDGLNGLTVPVRNPAALASALERLIGSQELRLSMGNAGRALVLEKFTLAQVVRTVFESYECLA